MNIGLFGGTFDPIHIGHLALAAAARERFKLARIYFVPANNPPHKQRHPVVAYAHRYTMVVLATAQEKSFLPSLLESPEQSGDGANYSIDTIRRLKKSRAKNDQLYLLMGVDAFQDIAKWHEAEALFAECEFVVASRPGYSLADIANALPETLRPRPQATKPFAKQSATGSLVLRGATVHLLEDVHAAVSATAIREAVGAGKRLTKFVPPPVEEYIKKMGLYRR